MSKNNENAEKAEKKENKTVSLDTMLNVGVSKTLAGREYKILPVNIEDMQYIMGEDSDNRLIILNRSQIENPEEKDITWQTFGLNIVDEKRKNILLKMINKYVYYKDIPMTEELVIEHGWSFKDIGEFILTWCEASD